MLHCLATSSHTCLTVASLLHVILWEVASTSIIVLHPARASLLIGHNDRLTLANCDSGTEHEHEMQCTLQGVPAVQPIRPAKVVHTASHLEQKLSLHPSGSDKKPPPRNIAFAASHLEARNTLHPM